MIRDVKDDDYNEDDDDDEEEEEEEEGEDDDDDDDNNDDEFDDIEEEDEEEDEGGGGSGRGEEGEGSRKVEGSCGGERLELKEYGQGRNYSYQSRYLIKLYVMKEVKFKHKKTNKKGKGFIQ